MAKTLEETRMGLEESMRIMRESIWKIRDIQNSIMYMVGKCDDKCLQIKEINDKVINL